MLSLRPYQHEAIEGLFGYWRENDGNALIVLPTGTGKSIVIARICQLCYEWDSDVRILMLTHVQELVEQNFKELIGLWPDAPAGIYSAGLKRREIRQVTFASIQSMFRKAELLQRVDIVLVDEAHLIPRDDETMYQRLLSDLRIINPDIRIVGLTATPYRLDTGRLDEGPDALFEIAYEYNVGDAIDEGYLAPLVTKATSSHLDVTGVGTRGGEYIPGELQRRVDRNDLNEAVVGEVIAKAGDRRSWLFFCSGVEHSRHIAEILQQRGVSCGVIHAKTDKEERRAIIADFKAGRLQALASMNVLTTGFNAPGVDLIAMLRPTQSRGLYIQMVGRGTRLAPGKDDCLVLDFARNIETHGPIDVDRQVRKFVCDDGEEGELRGAPAKHCPECMTYVFAAVRICPQCQYAWPKKPPAIQRKPSEATILERSAPSEWTAVDDMEVSVWHSRSSGVATMKVDYTCGIIRHTEWICFEHTGYAGERAQQWWRRRGGSEPTPKTVLEAIERAGELCLPDEILVRPEGKFTKIVAARNLPDVQPRREVVGAQDVPF